MLPVDEPYGAVDYLCRTLQRGRTQDRRRAAEALTAFGDAKSVHALRGAWRDSNDEVRFSALSASIGAGAGPSFEFALLALLTARRRNVAAAAAVLKKLSARCPEEAADWLTRVDLSPMFAIAMLEGLVGAGRHASSPALRIMTVSNPHAGVRAAALNALAAQGPSEACGAIVAALDDCAWEVRVCAAKAAGKLRVREARHALTNLREDPNWWVRTRASDALEQLGAASRNWAAA